MKVLLAEDSTFTRVGVVEILSSAGHEVDWVEDGTALEERCAPPASYDLVVTDVRMPPTHTDEGLRAALALQRLPEPIPVLVISAHIEVASATELLATAPGGVGYLLKDRVVDVAEFLAAVDRVAAGGVVVDPEVMRELLGARGVVRVVDRLTPRELEVLSLMAEGLTNAAIAARLVVTTAAVEKHIGNLFMKLDLPPDGDAHRRVAAVLAYLQSL
ncbi:response regulator [Nocardioides speluncae]|uniref:response regulator n=1 Tax=Nocardioides speluncae TaxID=2670337 RepID=UPI000D68EDB6|nr:response regulator transcription factor [Nocardioides speluncae]